MKICFTITLLLGTVLFSCQQSAFNPDTIAQDYITFGKGGGMANQVDTYYILRNGKVYHHNNLTSEYERLDRLDKSARTECFEQAQAIPVTNFGCNEPGNIYYFLSIHTDTLLTCTWGSNGFTPPAEIDSFYQYAHQLIKNKP